MKLIVPAAIGGLVALAAMWRWLWQTDLGPVQPPAEVGESIRLPVYVSGRNAHSWWGVVVLLLVAGTVFACLVFAYYYYWTITPGAWPPLEHALPGAGTPLASAALWIGSALALEQAKRALDRYAKGRLRLWLALALASACAAYALALHGQYDTGLAPSEHAYAASVYAFLAYQGIFVAVIAIMTAYLLARSWAGLLDGIRRVSFDNCRLFWLYSAGQALTALAIVYLSPAFAPTP